jgi:rod shape-determining protein MreD
MNWRRVLKGILIAIAVILLGFIQAGIFDRLKILECKPELVLCFVIVISCRMDFLQAGITGFAAGLYMDIVYGRYVGIYAFLYLTFCWIGSLLIGKAYERNRFLGLAVLPPLFFVYEVLESLMIRFIAVYTAGGGELYNYGYASHLVTRILPGAAYNLGVAIVFYMIMLLIVRIRKPKPDILYQGERGNVIDNAQ